MYDNKVTGTNMYTYGTWINEKKKSKLIFKLEYTIYFSLMSTILFNKKVNAKNKIGAAKLVIAPIRGIAWKFLKVKNLNNPTL